MWVQLLHTIRQEMIRQYWLTRIKLAQWLYIIQSALDPAPSFEQGESTEQYLQRIDRKHALRYVNFQINFFPPLSVESLERKLNTEKLKKADRKQLEQYLAIARHREKFQLLKEMLLQ